MVEINPLEFYIRSDFDDFVLINGLADINLEEQVRRYRTEMNNTSSFFRNPQLEMAVKHSIDFSFLPLQIAVVGCSRGQEAYTLLIRNWKNRNKFTINAVDISKKNLIAVRNGVYLLPFTSNQYRLINDIDGQSEICDFEYLSNLARNLVTQIKVTFSDSARNSIRTEQHDILSSPLPSKYDLITMCNVLIYYNPNGKRIIINNCARSLNPGGLLFLDDGYLNRFVDDSNLFKDNFDIIKLKMLDDHSEVLVYKKK